MKLSTGRLSNLSSFISRSKGPEGSSSLLVAALALAYSAVTPAATQFADVSAAAGVNKATETYGASWGDLNSDGLPDLYVNNHRLQSGLYLNRGGGTFYDVASQVQAWVNRPNADTHGGSFADFDNDGDQDLLITTGTGNPQQFLVNEHAALVDRTAELGVSFDNLGGRLPVWLDYNGDGLLDFVITQFGGAAKLFTQTPLGFVENTTDAGLLCLRFQYGHLMDVDGNGRLDFICQDDELFPQKIYDTLTLPWADITSGFPTVNQVPDSIIGDFNNDQRMDMFLISNVQLRPSSVLLADSHTIESALSGGEKGFNFVSSGQITIDLDWNKLDDGLGLTRILIGANGASPFAVPFTLDPADPNVAGLPPPASSSEVPVVRIGYDVATQRWTIIAQTDNVAFSEAYFVVTTAQPVTDLNSTGLWGSDQGGSPTLLMNYAGGFVDETVAAGLAAPIDCVSVTTGDFDNDMDLDLYLACRTGTENLQNIYYDNQGDGTFVAVPSAGGAAGPVGSNVTSGAGTADTAVVADYDADGFLDLFVTNGLALRPKNYGGQHTLFHNQGNANHWIELDLVGTATAREPVGARVEATSSGVTQLRVYNGSYHRWSQDAKRMHFGLADSATVDLTVTWPSGLTETFLNVAADHLYRVTEGGGFTTVIPGVGDPYACGAPAYDGGTEAGVFVWKDCLAGEWRVRMTAGGGYQSYSGRLVAPGGFTSVVPFSLETADVFDNTTDPLQIVFQLGMSNAGEDGFNVGIPSDVDSCFELDAPVGAQIFYGPFKAPVSAPFDLNTGGPCSAALPELSVSGVVVNEADGQADVTVSLSAASSGTVTVDLSTSDATATAGADYVGLTANAVSFSPGETVKAVPVTIVDDALGENDEAFGVNLSNPAGAIIGVPSATVTIIDNEVSACGEPVFDAGTEAGVFIWQDCTTGQWQARMTAGGSATTVTYTGAFISNAAFAQVAPFSNESTDMLDSTSDPLQIVYSFKMVGTGVDGVDFVPAAGTNVCFEPSLPVGATVYVGNNRTVVSPPFDLDTLGACGGLLPELNVAPVSVSEADGHADFTLSLSEVSTNTVTVDVQTADGSATAGADYSALVVTGVVFAPGEISKTISIPVLEDSLAEGNETFTLELSNVTNATIGTPSAVATIVDNEVSPCDTPTYDAGTESGVFVWKDCASGQWHIRVTGGGVLTTYEGRLVSTAAYSQLTGFSIESTDVLDNVTDPLQIAYRLTVGGTGQDGVDFTPAAGSSTCFELNAPGAASVYLGQSRTPVVAPFDLDTLGSCAALLPEVGISPQSAAENAAVVNVLVNLSAPSALPVTVDIATTDGSAFGGNDYVSLPATTVTIDAGQISKSVSLTLLDDAIAEGDEDLILSLSNPVNATLGSSSATFTIVDDEASPCGQPAFDPATEAGVFVWQDCASGQWHVRMASGGVYTVYQGSVSSSAAFTQISGFSIETADTLDTTTDPAVATYQLAVTGSGQDGIDFTPAVASNTCFAVDAPAGATVYVGASRHVTVSPFDLTTLGVCGQIPGVSVTDATIGESAGSAVFTISLSMPATVDVSVDYASISDTAAAPADYLDVSGTVSIPAGALSTTISVPLIDDSEIENNETFALVLSNPVSAILYDATGTGTIIDNDSASLSIDNRSEIETAGVMRFTVTMSTANLVPVTVDVATADMSATAGLDYVAVPATNLVFNPGETSKSIDVQLLDDTDIEGDETFSVTLSNASGAGIASAVGIGTITDSEPLPVISMNDIEVSEAAPVASFTVLLSTASTQPITVNYAVEPVTATPGADYTALPPGMLTFAPGETSKTIDVALINDSDIEGNETFSTTLNSPTRATLGSASATGLILDDESSPTLSVTDVSASEADGSLTFSVTLSVASTIPVSVDYTTVDGTAVAPADFAATSGTLTFAPGSTSATVVVPLVDDNELEFDEGFNLSLSNAVNASLGVVGAAATITDDEALVCGQPTYDPATEAVVVVWKDCSTGIWSVRMTAGSGFKSYPGSVVSNQGYTAVAGVSIESGDFFDFTTNPTTILYRLGMSPPGEDGFNFTLSQDATACFNVNLPPGTAIYVGAGRTPVGSSFDLTTLGTCQSLPVLTVSDVSVVENAGPANFVLNLSSASADPVSIDYQVVDGTATAGLDYTAPVPGTLVFAPGEISKSISVALLDDTELEPDETFALSLTHPVNVSLGAASIALNKLATIMDNEVQAAFTVADLSVAETDGSIAYTVNLMAPAANTVSVDVQTLDGSAVAGSDYSAVPPTTLTFQAGETSKVVNITLTDDNLAEGPETFQLQLSNPIGAPISNALATVTITDNEPSPCGVPSYDPATESAMFMWKDCENGQWSVRLPGGSSFKVFTGALSSDLAYQSVIPFSIESNDVLDFATDPAVIDYGLRVGATYEDGFEFVPAPGASVCVDLTGPTGTPVYLGAARTALTAPFDLGTLGLCN